MHCCHVPIQVSQDGFMLLICMFFGCDMAIQLVLSSEYDDYDSLEDHFVMYRFMSWTDWWMKRWEIVKDVSMNCTAFTHYVMLMAQRTCARLHRPLKLLPNALLSCTNSSQLGWFRVAYMHVLWLWYDNPASAIKWVWRLW